MSELIARRKSEFTIVFDMSLRSEAHLEQMEEQAKDVLELAGAVQVLLDREIFPATGSTLRDIQIGIAMVEDCLATGKNLLEKCQKLRRKSGISLANLEVCVKTKALEAERLAIDGELYDELTGAEKASEQITVLHAQMEGLAASLEKSLPL